MPQASSIKRVGTWLVALAAVAGITWFAPPMARAQNTTSGTVVGQVVDAQGKAITGAVVTLTNGATNGVQATISNSAGRYAFVNLQPGTYSLSVKKEGFKAATISNQLVIVGKQLTLNVPMQVGAATQTVEVTASGAELQTMNATVGDTVSGAAIMVLPNLTRDANSLTNLQPNTEPGGGVAGADADQNSFTLDGGNNSDDMDGSHADYNGTQGGATSGVIPVPADSIEQFSVATDNQTADVNSAAGATVSMVTKRGTPTVHGSAYDYYLGSYLAANSWGNNQSNTPRAKSHQNRFGASLGGEILPNFLGGKTYLFGLYEGRRYPNQATYSRPVPTALLRLGVLQTPNKNCVDASGNALAYGTQLGDNGVCTSAGYAAYNLNQTSVVDPTGGATINPAICTAAAGDCDPRKLGFNPVIAQLWKQYLPLPNKSTGGDKHNTLNYTASRNAAMYSNFFVTRLDHDFGAKNHLDVTYHFFYIAPDNRRQVDIGGGVPGDTFGVPTTTSQVPQEPSMWSAQLTSSLTPNLTNSFNYSYLRNFWQWSGVYLQPTPLTGLGTLGGTLEVGGETSNALIPYNINTQNTRTRFWDGIGNTFQDSLSLIKGNHLIQFGGRYTHQLDYHQRNDNGGSVMANTVYQIAGGAFNQPLPLDSTSNGTGTYQSYYDELLGITTIPQTLYTRSGPTLQLQPLGTPMFDKSSIPMYNVFFSDSWHMRPDLTLTYGTGYTVEMPPLEQKGKQVIFVDSGGNPITTQDYTASEERAALGGRTYTPTVGWATVANVGAGLKYPYHPFYGGLSPRVSIAWNPTVNGGLLGAIFGGNKSVIRGGWSRIYGRLNGVDLVLVPLLGTGLGQPIQCIGAQSPTLGSGACGAGTTTPANAFRIGPTSAGFDGMTAPLGPPPTPTLAQPYIPGELVNGTLNASSGAGSALDPTFKPNHSDEFDITFQRQVSQNFTMEVGYVGRIIRNEFQEMDLVHVPYMLTAGGQQFQQAFAQMWKQIAAGANITPETFFEQAMGGPGSSFCSAYASCTAAVAAKFGPSGKDYIDPTTGNDITDLWNALSTNSAWTMGRTSMNSPTTCSTPGVGGCPANGIASGTGQASGVDMNYSGGYGNYNSLFWTVNMRNWHNITATSNFTWSRSFGTGQVDQASSEYTVVDPFNLSNMYGPQYNDRPLQENLFAVWTPGSKTQHGLIGHLAHGWSFAPVLTWSIPRDYVNIGCDCLSVGEGYPGIAYSNELAVKTSGYTPPSSVVSNVTSYTGGVGSDSNPAAGGTGMNRYGSSAATYFAQFRPYVLGLDQNSQSAWFNGLSQTNVDFAVNKDLAISERFGAELSAQATNVFNHFSPAEEGYDITNPASFGAISGNSLNPRTVEIGLRIHW